MSMVPVPESRCIKPCHLFPLRTRNCHIKRGVLVAGSDYRKYQIAVAAGNVSDVPSSTPEIQIVTSFESPMMKEQAGPYGESVTETKASMILEFIYGLRYRRIFGL
jgi:hypothetical protein